MINSIRIRLSWISPVLLMLIAAYLPSALCLGADPASINPVAGQKTVNIKTDISTPESCVESLHAALLQIMKLGDSVSCAERYDILEPVLTDIFDFSLTSRLVLGRYWRKLTPEKRLEFVHAFTTMSIATYAERFSSYSHEKFSTISIKQIKNNRVMVKTVLITSKGEEIPLDYTCVLSKDGWRIAAVTAKGVNDLALKRSEYTDFLKDKPIDDLISFLRKQADRCHAPVRAADISMT